MELKLQLPIEAQPDDSTCGPTCLHAVYGYYDDPVSLTGVIAEVTALSQGGTLAVFLARHAMLRGYRATIVTYNVQIFDPTWFADDSVDITQKLKAQARCKGDEKLHVATRGYIEFLELGGQLRFEDLTADLIRIELDRGHPILTGLSATFLYRSEREIGWDGEEDDVRGEPVGHFVVLCGYDQPSNSVLLADPLQPNPVSTTHIYSVDIDRAINAILLGVLTYDANLLILEKPDRSANH